MVVMEICVKSRHAEMPDMMDGWETPLRCRKLNSTQFISVISRTVLDRL